MGTIGIRALAGGLAYAVRKPSQKTAAVQASADKEERKPTEEGGSDRCDHGDNVRSEHAH